jgi:hypothetical protein
MTEELEPQLVLKPKRIKAWVSRYTSMIKQHKFTKAVARIRASLGDELDGLSLRDGGDWEEDVLSDDEESDSEEAKEEDEWLSPAPRPAATGYQHQDHLTLVTDSAVVGHRLQYRWRNCGGWMHGIVREPAKRYHTKRTFDIECADGTVVSGVQLNLSEHGAMRRWVLWEWAPPQQQQTGAMQQWVEGVPIATPPEGWKIVTSPPLVADNAFLTTLKRKGRKGTVVAGSRKVMYRFDAPVDWHVGEVTIVHKKGKLKGGGKDARMCENGFVKVVYAKDSQFHELQLGAHGVQAEWVVLEPTQEALQAAQGEAQAQGE